MDDVLIIGGGVIGLSLAWELAQRGLSVQVIDQGEPGREASWAGAGIIPAAKYFPSQYPYEQLRGMGAELHPRWAKELKSLTGIDNGYRRCGGLHLARTPGEAAALAAWATMLREEDLDVEQVAVADLGEIEPQLARGNCLPSAALLIPAEAQIRNPWHLQALTAACQQSGVNIAPRVALKSIRVSGSTVAEVETTAGLLTARQFCIAAGAWTGQLLRQAGRQADILPIRGQMVLFRCAAPPISRIINVGSRYLVPREDGHLLAGSTEEEVGFDKRTTEEAIAELIDFARSLVPELHLATVKQTWAGLRPGSFDGLPYLGPLPGVKNAFIAAGHFRSGLYLSPATAVVMSQLMRGETPQVDLAPFRVGR